MRMEMKSVRGVIMPCIDTPVDAHVQKTDMVCSLVDIL